MSDERSFWIETRAGIVCERCDWRYMVVGAAPGACPHCGSTRLARLDDDAADGLCTAPPELVVPYAVSQVMLAQQVAAFAAGIPYPPPDLSVAALQSRLQRLYLPMWLVDADVTAQWGAEVGYDYDVVSHQERYTDGAGWRTDEVRETRVRWEPRVGTLQRHYDNVAVPALDSHAALQRVLGSFRIADAVGFGATTLDDSLVRMPDRTPEAAWPEAAVALQQRAAEECRVATEADAIRDYRWAPTVGNQAWTLLLLPVLAAAYLDDDGVPRRVLIHGQTGQIYGAKYGSMKRAGRASLTIGAVALTIFAVGLILALLSLLFPPLLVIGVIVALIALPVGAGAAIPVMRVSAHNRRQAAASMEV